MGIKPTYIKSIGNDIIKNYDDRYSTDFNDNKALTQEITTIESKQVRNRVAGYITRKLNTGKRK
jgi:small subunit ribosomal protein S17e